MKEGTSTNGGSSIQFGPRPFPRHRRHEASTSLPGVWWIVAVCAPSGNSSGAVERAEEAPHADGPATRTEGPRRRQARGGRGRPVEGQRPPGCQEPDQAAPGLATGAPWGEKVGPSGQAGLSERNRRNRGDCILPDGRKEGPQVLLGYRILRSGLVFREVCERPYQKTVPSPLTFPGESR